jgi:hypothetical protein
MEFVLNGHRRALDERQVLRALAGMSPEPVREHGVRVGGVVYPVKQAFAAATGVPRTEFASQTALRQLAALGFEMVGSAAGGARTGDRRESRPPPLVAQSTPSHGWPWEGHVQSLFAAFLHAHGWLLTSMADTSSRGRGVDVLARKGTRQLGAEVKGWPSTRYADPRRAAEAKRTQPTTQAGHWFSQAVVKAMMLLDTHPGHESLVVVPDYPRYRAMTLP